MTADVVEFPNAPDYAPHPANWPPPAPATNLWRRATVKVQFTEGGLAYTIAEECWWREGGDMHAAVTAIRESMKTRYRLRPSVGAGQFGSKWSVTVDQRTYDEASDE